MYNINQLNQMSDGQLRELAKSMGLKRVDSADHDDLVYQVLDHQAETEAANAPEQGRRRRERIRQPAAKANGNEVIKDDAVVTKKNQNKEDDKIPTLPKMEEAPVVKPITAADEVPAETEPPKRKRGRPSAAEIAARVNAEQQTPEPMVADTPAGPTLEQVVEPVAEQVKEQPQRRRGRKPKQAMDEPVLPFDNLDQQQEKQPQPEPIVEQFQEPDRVDETPAEPEEQRPAAPVPEREDVSLNSFFNTGGGITFKPRTQQEREEAQRRSEEDRRRQAEQAAIAPIVIQEPKVVKESKNKKRKRSTRR